jgi:hypothetical protein
MQTNTKPDTGNLSATQLKESLVNQVKDCEQVLHTRVTRLTIVISGFAGREAVNKVFNFPAGTVPENELKQFFESYATRLSNQAFALECGVPLIRYGSSIVSLDAFIKDYTAGIFPSMSGEDAAKLTALKPGEFAIIQVNNIAVNVQRIN